MSPSQAQGRRAPVLALLSAFLLAAVSFLAAAPLSGAAADPSAMLEKKDKSLGYIREGGRLVRVEDRDESGALRGSIEYRYDALGRLLSARASGSMGSGDSGLLGSAAAPEASWFSSADGSSIFRYDRRGRLIESARLQDGKQLEQELRVYAGESELPTRSVRRIRGGELEVTTDFDGRGNALRELTMRGHVEVSLRTMSYDEQGRLSEETLRSAASLSVSRFTYAATGGKLSEELRKNGQLVMIRRWEANGVVEELYQNDSLFVKIHYAAGRKIKEEFFSAGRMIRERIYP